ncbi:hypothetical protein ACRB8A_03835 [Arthrobacter sp. G.S.26]|uniref:hypothetical protein n=1 Tax=Arthrobacter sp. G.S.26 TaxID=3433706 RepID=UPI003D77325E
MGILQQGLGNDVTAFQEVRVKCAGGWVDAYVSPHEREVLRRRSLGVLAMPQDLESLDILLRVPLEGAVSEAIFSRRERDKLRRLGPGLLQCDVDGTGRRTVRRLVVPPASVSQIVVRGRNWRSALVRATRFAPYCRRAIMLPAVPVDEEMLLLEARFYGVGVAVSIGAGEAPVWRLEPAPFVPDRYTGASWQFSELVFEAWQSAQERAATAGSLA